jgi:hypothetical protein
LFVKGGETLLEVEMSDSPVVLGSNTWAHCRRQECVYVFERVSSHKPLALSCRGEGLCESVWCEGRGRGDM